MPKDTPRQVRIRVALERHVRAREWVWGVSFRPLNDSCNKNNFFSIFIAVLTVLSNWEGLRTLLANMQHQVQDPNGSASVDWRSGFSYCHPTRQNVKSPEGLMRIFYTGAFHRTTGETKMNHVSSRSHALLTQVIKQKVRVINLYFSIPPFLFSILLSFVSFRGKF